MTMNHINFPYAGIYIDTFNDGTEVYATITSVADGIGLNRNTVKSYLTRTPEVKDQGIGTEVPTRNGIMTKAYAYPIPAVMQMVIHFANKGNPEAQALRDASAIENLQNRVEEAHGLGKTAAVREARLAKSFNELLQNYVMTLPLNAVGRPELLDSQLVDNGELTQEEYSQAADMAYCREKCEKIANAKKYRYTQAHVEMFRNALNKMASQPGKSKLVQTVMDEFGIY